MKIIRSSYLSKPYTASGEPCSVTAAHPVNRAGAPPSTTSAALQDRQARLVPQETEMPGLSGRQAAVIGSFRTRLNCVSAGLRSSGCEEAAQDTIQLVEYGVKLACSGRDDGAIVDVLINTAETLRRQREALERQLAQRGRRFEPQSDPWPFLKDLADAMSRLQHTLTVRAGYIAAKNVQPVEKGVAMAAVREIHLAALDLVLGSFVNASKELQVEAGPTIHPLSNWLQHAEGEIQTVATSPPLHAAASIAEGYLAGAISPVFKTAGLSTRGILGRLQTAFEKRLDYRLWVELSRLAEGGAAPKLPRDATMI